MASPTHTPKLTLTYMQTHYLAIDKNEILIVSNHFVPCTDLSHGVATLARLPHPGRLSARVHRHRRLPCADRRTSADHVRVHHGQPEIAGDTDGHLNDGVLPVGNHDPWLRRGNVQVLGGPPQKKTILLQQI